MLHLPTIPRYNLGLIISCVLATFGYYTAAIALPSDRNQILALSADQAKLSQENRQGIFTGHVIFDQGTTHIRALKATTTTNASNQLDIAIAYGSKEQPVHFWTQTALDKPDLHAYATEMRYYPGKHTIELIGNAKVQQGEDTMHAANIVYDTVKQRIVTTSTANTRVHIIIHPRDKT